MFVFCLQPGDAGADGSIVDVGNVVSDGAGDVEEGGLSSNVAVAGAGDVVDVEDDTIGMIKGMTENDCLNLLRIILSKKRTHICNVVS